MKRVLLANFALILAISLNAQQTGIFKDPRNSKTYKTVKIGTQTWMAENMNYTTSSGSWCYDNITSNCNKYGRLYNWETAKTVCPSGWHLPSDAEWTTLTNFVGNDAGEKLKSTSGWNSSSNGINAYGFNALPGGNRNRDGIFNNIGDDGDWWSASESSVAFACYRTMPINGSNVYWSSGNKELGFSVRCVRD